MNVSIQPAAAHSAWQRSLAEMSVLELHEHAHFIEEAAGELGIWERGGHLPVQPFIIDAAANQQVFRIGSRLKALLVGYALNVAENDLSRLADIAEWHDDQRWFINTRRPLSDALVSSRADVFITGGQARFLELNIGTCLNGATSSSVLSKAFLDSPVGREMRRLPGIRSNSYLEELIHWVGRRYTSESPNGIPCDFVPVEEADIRHGSLVWNSRPYGFAIRYFMITPEVVEHRDFVLALEHATRTRLFGAYVSQLFGSKVLLADLYQHDQLTSGERWLLSHVPWMARLRQGIARRDEGEVEPVEWAANHREHAVLKPGNLFGSRGLVVGPLTSESRWRDALDHAVRDGGHVVQEVVRPDTWTNAYWHVGSETLISVDSPAQLGPYVVAGADAGCSTRQPIRGTEEDLLTRDRDLSLGCVMYA